MSSVDDRIVNMKFNNAQFTQGVDKTKRDLTGLEQTISKAGQAKGMTQLSSSVSQVSTKFSALQIAGTAALATIASKATSAGLSLIKKFTLGPIIDGFREYQTNLESYQTIMANTGKSIEPVKRRLEELNKYSDQTIYNFSQMARNIGTFTAAGVKLGQATSAIKGISNLAALSGSNSEQASRAMYQLSQAIAASRVNLQDWNSVVNAGMGGKVFKNALAQTAVAMGRISKDAVKVGTDVSIMGKTFRESISAKSGEKPWLDSKVLVNTLAQLDGRFSRVRLKMEGVNSVEEQNNLIKQERIKLAKKGIVYSDKEFKAMVKTADAAFSAATQIKTFPQLMSVIQESIGSMWANAFTLIVGDFNQSKKLWGAVGDAITGENGILTNISSTFLGMLRTWSKEGGREAVLGGLGNIFGSLYKIIMVVGKAFRDIFPPSTGNTLIKLSKAFENFTKGLVVSQDTLDDLRSIFGAIFSVFHLGITIISGIAKAFGAFFGALFSSSEGARGGILSMIASVAEVIIGFEQWLTAGGRMQSFLAGIGKVAGTALAPLVAVVGLLVSGFASLISGEGLGGAMKAFNKAKAIFGDFIYDMIDGLDQLTAPLDPLKEKLADLGVKVWEKFSPPFDKFLGKLQEAKDQFISGLGLDDFSIDIDAVKNKIINFVNGISFSTGPLHSMGEAINWVTTKIKELWDSLDIMERLKTVGNELKSLVESIFGGGKGAASAAGGSAMAAQASVTEGIFNRLKSVVDAIGGAISATFNFIGNLIGSLFNMLGKIPFPDDLLEWAQVLNLLVAGALVKRIVFSKSLWETFKETVRELGEGFKSAMSEVTNTLKVMQGSIKSTIIKNIGIAVALLTGSLIALSFVPVEKLGVGLGALAAMIGLLVGAMKILTGGMGPTSGMKPKELAALAKALTAQGAALASLSVAVTAFAISIATLTAAVIPLSMLSWEQLAKGIGGVAVMMGILVLSMKAFEKVQSTKVAAVGAAMLLMAAAIDILVLAILALAFIPMENLNQGIGAIAKGLGLMVLALLALGGVSGKVAFAGAAMVMMAAAMDVLVGAILALAFIPFENLDRGLKAIATGIGIMVLGLLALSAAGPSAMAAGAAILMLSAALSILVPLIIMLGAVPADVIAVGLMAIAAGLGLLVLAGYLAIAAAPGLAALSTIILALGASMLMAGMGMTLFAAGLTVLTVVGVAAIGIMVAAIGAFIALLPSIALQVAAAFVSFLQAMAIAAPKVRTYMGIILGNMIDTVRDQIPKLQRLFQDLVDAGIEVITDSAGKLAEAGYELIDRVLNAAEKHVPNIVDSAISLVTKLTETLGNRVGELADAGLQMLVDIMDGLSDAIENSNKVRDAARNLARTFADELREMLGEFLGSINPLNYLPDISLSDLRNMLPGGNGRMSADSYAKINVIDPLTKALTNAGTAITNAVRLFTGAMSGATYTLAYTAKKMQQQATYSATLAETRRTTADNVTTTAENMVTAAAERRQRANDMKQGAKRDRAIRLAKAAQARANRFLAAAKAKQEEASRLEAEAERRQAIADYADKEAQDAVQYKDDARGYGQARQDVGEDLADEAQRRADVAKAKRDEANRLLAMAKTDSVNSYQYRLQAVALRKEADREIAYSLLLSSQAMEAQAQAVKAFDKARKQTALEVLSRMKTLKWESDYDKASQEQKIKMLTKRAEASEKKAAEAQKKFKEAFQESEAIAAAIKRGEKVTQEQIDVLLAAEKQAELAKQASDAAEADRNEIKNLLGSSGGGSSPGSLTPSRSVLEDAGKAVDRYTQSVRQAEEMAQASSTSTNFVQNNYSPVALSSSEIYRQSKNLISSAEIKIGAK